MSKPQSKSTFSTKNNNTTNRTKKNNRQSKNLSPYSSSSSSTVKKIQNDKNLKIQSANNDKNLKVQSANKKMNSNNRKSSQNKKFDTKQKNGRDSSSPNTTTSGRDSSSPITATDTRRTDETKTEPDTDTSSRSRSETPSLTPSSDITYEDAVLVNNQKFRLYQRGDNSFFQNERRTFCLSIYLRNIKDCDALLDSFAANFNIENKQNVTNSVVVFRSLMARPTTGSEKWETDAWEHSDVMFIGTQNRTDFLSLLIATKFASAGKVVVVTERSDDEINSRLRRIVQDERLQVITASETGAIFKNCPYLETLRRVDDLSGINEVMKRDGAECKVPIQIWTTPVFKSWYDNMKKKVGNRLSDANLQYVFRVGKDKKSVLYWILHPDIAIEIENDGDKKRHKSNEIVIGRTDVKTVVPYYIPVTAIDPNNGSVDVMSIEVALVKEFRSTSRTPDGYIYEFPGGSSFRERPPDDDGKDAGRFLMDEAIKELNEELTEEKNVFGRDNTYRLANHGFRQLAGTTTCHGDHVFSIQLSKTQYDGLVKNIRDGKYFGNAAETERTYPILQTVRQVLESKFLDWASLGMLWNVLYDVSSKNYTNKLFLSNPRSKAKFGEEQNTSSDDVQTSEQTENTELSSGNNETKDTNIDTEKQTGGTEETTATTTTLPEDDNNDDKNNLLLPSEVIEKKMNSQTLLNYDDDRRSEIDLSRYTKGSVGFGQRKYTYRRVYVPTTRKIKLKNGRWYVSYRKRGSKRLYVRRTRVYTDGRRRLVFSPVRF